MNSSSWVWVTDENGEPIPQIKAMRGTRLAGEDETERYMEALIRQQDQAEAKRPASDEPPWERAR